MADLQLAAKKRALLLAKKKALLKKEGVNTPDPTGASGVRSTASIDSIGHGGGPHLGARVSNVRAQVVAKLAESSPSQSKPVVTPEVFDQIVPALKPAIEKKQAQYNEALISKPTPQKATNMVSVFGNLPELDWTIEADRRRLLINLEGMLLPWIQKIVEKGRSQRTSLAIDGLHLRLEYLPWTDCFVTNLSEEVLYTVMTSRFGLGELSMKPGDVIEDDLQEGLGFSERVITAEDLLWLAGLWTVQGRVLPADDPSRTRRLTRSPDCIRDIVIPEVHAVINLWQTRPMTAFQVISELNIPQRFVFGVMAAATTAQLFAY
ncbi:hypothetical protein [Neptunomonas concharum]|uniref:hypothetical protein n=1 Tax=Neptunomonas concharum TaxID=1031538 RepID=UPI0011106A1B|nr:hypothetical protein [Neptunomonas concharum]